MVLVQRLSFHRLHYVCINGTSSSCLPVLFGVPQGSVLGPLLFLSYVNDLPNNINFSSTYLFADDTKCVLSVSSYNESSWLQDDINSLLNWCSDWKLSLNLNKCSCMHLSLVSSDSTSSYQIGNLLLTLVPNHHDFSIIIDPNLKFSEH